jgi:hypothetical protein
VNCHGKFFGTMALRNHPHFYNKLKTANKPQWQKYITEASDDEILSVCECALNLKRGNLPCTRKQARSLCKHKVTLRTLARTRNPRVARQILVQKGGFLPMLAAAVIPLVADFILRKL